MKLSLPLAIACSAVLVTGSCSIGRADGDIKRAILELFPQADANRDGAISDAEEAALSRLALKRFPQADRDGDGVLSDAEKRTLLRLAAKRRPGNPDRRPPSFANVKYGERERHVFDIWLAGTRQPSPLAVYIHGGGFRSGSKEKLDPKILAQLLEAGISVAAINYRYVTTAPLPTAHHDAARALQFMRSRAGVYGIDKTRVAVFGGSAGAQISMWLAYSDDMAIPASRDPIARESTRVTCVVSKGGQTTNDIAFWRTHLGPLLGNDQQVEALERPVRDSHLETWGAASLKEANTIAKRHSALTLISADDPPIFMSYGMSPTAKLPTDPTKVRGWLVHHVNFGIALKAKADAMDVEAHLTYPGATSDYASDVTFMTAKLLRR